jgi:hypothetical protein
VADFAQMQQTIATAKEHFGEINGIIHAAGVPSGGLIQQKSREMASKILVAKVKGTLILDDLCQDMPLDFFVVTSSLNSVIPVLGQVDYCAANAFLDTFAQYKSSQGTFTVAVNWDAWQEVGMAAAMTQEKNKKANYTKIAHPLLDRIEVTDLDNINHQKIYISHLDSNETWILQEHIVMGQPTIPGTGYLEMVRAAFEHLTNHETCELREVFFLTPLTVKLSTTKEVKIIFMPQGNEWQFEISSRISNNAEQWQKHCVGEIAILDQEAAIPKMIPDIATKLSGQETISVTAKESPGGLIKFGPRWDNVKWLKFSQDQLEQKAGLAFLELNPNFIADIATYKLHPALLDNATGFMGVQNQDGVFLPFSYKKIQIKKAMPDKIYSYIKQLPTNPELNGLKMDVTITDETGAVVVEIQEYSLRKIKPN